MKPWRGKEIRYIRGHAAEGADKIAEALGRSVASVRSLAQRQRISLRRKGSRGGRVLGQPAGVSLRRGLREDLVSGRVKASVLAQRVALDHEAELCPCCALRPIRVSSSGLCGVCHTTRLAQAHEEALSELEARRDLWTARQRLKRTRDLEDEETAGAGYCSGEPDA